MSLFTLSSFSPFGVVVNDETTTTTTTTTLPGQFDDADDDDDDDVNNFEDDETHILDTRTTTMNSKSNQNHHHHTRHRIVGNNNNNNNNANATTTSTGTGPAATADTTTTNTTDTIVTPLKLIPPTRTTTVTVLPPPPPSSTTSLFVPTIRRRTTFESQKHHPIIHDDDNDDDDDDNDDDDYDDYTATMSIRQRSSSSIATTSASSTNISHKVQNKVQQLQHLEYSKRTLHTDKNDRATSEQVLDPRTRYILFKLLQSNVLQDFHGCISTGKEANVYYATTTANANANAATSSTTATTKTTTTTKVVTEYAVKIYKTSILVFKDRDKYVSGEYRYRNGYCKSNPRKMISIWAEKEIRNYKRIYYHSTIPCPQPILIKQHVLIMEFLGHQGWPSPRLKDVVFTDALRNTKYYNIYIQCIMILRQLVQQCKLIHGDYSEYNLLYHHNTIYVIDVSQSVELNHPIALDLLKQDIINITDYFKKIFYKTNYHGTLLLNSTTTTCATTTTTISTTPHASTDIRHHHAITTTNNSGKGDIVPMVPTNTTNGTDTTTSIAAEEKMDQEPEDYYLLNPMEAFDYIMMEGNGCPSNNNSNDRNNIENKDTNHEEPSVVAYDRTLLHQFLEEGKRRRREQQSHGKEQQDAQKYESIMKERLFLNSYIPRTLNEITVTERDYVTVASQPPLRPNAADMVPSIEAQAIAAMTIHPSLVTPISAGTVTAPRTTSIINTPTRVVDDGTTITVTTKNHTTMIHATPDHPKNGMDDVDPGDTDCTIDRNPHSDFGNNNEHIDEEENDDDESSRSSTTSSGDEQYERRPRTPEEIEQERMIRKELRRTNKKAVKEQQSVKRQNKKMKKKDKKRAITKTKTKT
jgi:RIO kinase 1